MLKQTDVHWVEKELLRMREEVFLGVLKRVMTEIEGEALKEAKFCEKCGLVLVRNGRERRNANPLLKLRLLKLNGEWDVYWQQRRKEFVRYAA